MRRSVRAGFTLIELMVVIVVIAILMGLLFPAYRSVMQRAREAHVKTEITSLMTAVKVFEAFYGAQPPSRIILCEASTDWPSEVSSRAAIRQIWPQFDFSKDRDINGDGLIGPPLEVKAGECLTFFLGGIMYGLKPTGFSKNPTDPFYRPTASESAERAGPFFEFDTSRLKDFDGDRIPEYLDPFPAQSNPYVYYSGYNGAGYRDADLDHGMSSVYTISDRIGVYNKNSFQIISPGQDGAYGSGGTYDVSNQQPSLANGRPTDSGMPNAFGRLEYDNITNFSMGKLLP